MKWHLFLTVCFGLSLAFPSCTQSAIRGDHPRIYLTKDTIPEIQRRCREEYKPLYDALLTTRWILDQTPGVGYSDMTNMMLPAFLYIVEGCDLYAQKTKAYLEALWKNPPKDQYLTPEYIRQAAACYDWIFDRLQEEEKKQCAQALVQMGDYLLTLWRHSDFNNHFINETLSVIYIGVVLYGDGVDDVAAERFLKIGRDLLIQHAVPAANEIAGDDGGQAEGFSYNDWGFACPLAHTVEMWRVATGEDWFADSPFFKTQSFWHLYCQRPHDGSFVKAEDCPSGFQPGEDLKSFIHLVGTRCSDGYAQWLGDRIPWKYKQKAWKEILWRDPKLQAVSPETLPLARHFKKLGWVVSRSGWKSKDDTFLLFQCGDFYAGHQHLDANSFVIHKGGSLAIDSGVNEYSSHRANYYCRTIAHNGILIFDPREIFSGEVWSAEGSGGSNDGGQMRGIAIERVGDYKKGGSSDVADITQYYNTPNFTYICGDASRAYHPQKLRSFTRQFIHIQPDFFVVFDRVVSTDPSFRKTWLLHSVNEPEREGNRFTIRNGNGILVGWTLLPESPIAEKIGGSGREYWVNGKNYPPTSKDDPEAGKWRLEISPEDKRESDLFLHVLQAGLVNSLEEAHIQSIGTGHEKGVQIQWKDLSARILLMSEGYPRCSIRIERGGTLVEDRILGEGETGITQPERLK